MSDVVEEWEIDVAVDVAVDEDQDVDTRTPPEILEAANLARGAVLPDKSKKRYMQSYEKFVEWQSRNNVPNRFNENILLAYFREISTKYCPTTLWSMYSMLNSVVSLKHKIHLDQYTELHAFLKKGSKNYESTKADVFSDESISTFLQDAPDYTWLVHKVVMVFGIFGACRTDEFPKICTSDLKCHPGIMVVQINDTKTGVKRSFTISDEYYHIVEKYRNLRPPKVLTSRFFLRYERGRCTAQVIGYHKFSKMASDIAEFLGFDDTKRFTGHSFRRTSASIVANSGADMTTLKRHGGWKSSTVAEGYVENSLNYKRKTESMIKASLRDVTSHVSNDSSASKRICSSSTKTSVCAETAVVPRNMTVASKENIPIDDNSVCGSSFPDDDHVFNEQFVVDSNNHARESNNVPFDAMKHFTFNNCHSINFYLK